MNELTTEEAVQTQIGQRLTAICKKRNIKATQIADKLNVSRATVSQWFQGKNLGFSTLAILSENLEVSLNWLLLGQGQEQRCTDLTLTPDELKLITALRHLGNDISKHSYHFLRGIKEYNSRHTSSIHFPSLEKFFSHTKTAWAIVDISGKIVEANRYHDELTGLLDEHNQPIRPLCFDLLAPEYKRPVRDAINHIMVNGVGDYNYREILHYKTKERIPVISKAHVITYRGNLAIRTILKPVFIAHG